MIRVGFALLTHDQPARAERLVRTLRALYDHPPIAWHHDAGAAPMPELIAAGAEPVRAALRCAWGDFSLVEASLRAVRQLVERHDPDWITLLSGADYPVAPPRRVLAELASSPFDAYLRHELIDPRRFARDWQRLCWRRYAGRDLRLPLPGGPRRLRLRGHRLPWLRHPFVRGLRCYAGEAWWTLGRRAARILLERHDRGDLARVYAERPIADESYVHTLLANDPRLRLCDDARRFVVWDGGAHPRTLVMADLPAIAASGAWFARKFDPRVDNAVLDQLDARQLGASAGDVRPRPIPAA